MNRKTLSSLALAMGLALFGGSAASAATVLSHTPVHLELKSVMTSYLAIGELDGTLSLIIEPSGIVKGIYRPATGTLEIVTGGTDGEHIWLDIGSSDNIRVSGTLKDGTITGSAVVGGFRDPFKFVANLRH
jgi:hypothetical protein